ncbi:MAG: ABC transporter permease [Defluviitaleaceae bacterium]|nr:ABC transporter permease [Defluviitaleaceae bacterium]
MKSMLKKFTYKLIFAFIWLGLLVASFIIFDQLGGRGYTILIATPMYGTVETNEIEPYNNIADIKITYMSPQSARISAMGHYHHGTIIGTNQYFADVMSHFMIDRDFFTYEAVKYAHNVAVLNQNAAITIFGERRVREGTFYHDGQSFYIVGVIYDRDNDNINIYVPLTSISKDREVDAIAFNAGISYFHNQPAISIILEALNITEENHHIINLFAASVVIENYHLLVVTLFILIIFEAIGNKAIKIGIGSWRKIGKINEDEFHLWKTIFSKSFLALLVAIVVIVAILITIGMESMEVYMNIIEIINIQNPFAAIPETVFSPHIQGLARWYFWTVTVFWISVVIFVLYLVVNFWRLLAPKESDEE